MKRKQINWHNNDIFVIPLNNNYYSIGQILDQRMKNTLRITLFNETVDSLENLNIKNLCDVKNLISLLEVTKEQIVYGVWKILGNKETEIPFNLFPNEQFREKNWINSMIYDAALAEDFVNAYNSLIPWDDWHDPIFLDEFLYDKNKKTRNLIYI